MSFVICKVAGFTITYYIITCFVFGLKFGNGFTQYQLIILIHFEKKESFIEEEEEEEGF